MTDINVLWIKASAVVKMALAAVDKGLVWQRVGELGDSVKGMQALGADFNIMCVSAVFDDKRCYEAVVTLIKPEFSIVRLPEDAAKYVWDKAVSSLN